MGTTGGDDFEKLKQELDQAHNQLQSYATQLTKLDKKFQMKSKELINMVSAQGNLYRFQEKIEQQKTIYAQIAETGHRFNQSQDLDGVFTAASRICVDLLNFEKCALLLLNSDSLEFEVKQFGGYNQESERAEISRFSVSHNHPACVPFSDGRPKHLVRLNDDGEADRLWRNVFKIDEFCIFSLGVADGHVRGLLIVGNSRIKSEFHRRVEHDEELDALMSNLTSQIVGAQTTAKFMQLIQYESAQVHRLLDNMKQAVFSVDGEGVITEPVSRHSAEIFGQAIVGANIYETVFKDLSRKGESRSKMETVFATAFGEGELQWGLVCDDFPAYFHYRRRDGTEDIRTLKLNVQPIWDDKEVLEKIMFVIEDVSEIEKLERQISNERFEIEIIQQILHNDLQDVDGFFSKSLDYLWQCVVLHEREKIDTESMSVMMRTLHTLKGNSRLFGFTHISKTVHEAESHFLELRGALLNAEKVRNSGLQLRMLESLARIAESVYQHSRVAQKVFKLNTGMDALILKLQVLSVDSEFPPQEAVKQLRLCLGLLKLTASGVDLSWIENGLRQWRDLDFDQDRDIAAEVHEVLSVARGVVARAELTKAALGGREVDSLARLMEAAEWLSSNCSSGGKTAPFDATATIYLLKGLDPVFFDHLMQSLGDRDARAESVLRQGSGEWIPYVLLSATTRFLTQDTPPSETGFDGASIRRLWRLWSFVTGSSVDSESLLPETDFDWLDFFESFIQIRTDDQWKAAIIRLQQQAPHFAKAICSLLAMDVRSSSRYLTLRRMLALGRILGPFLQSKDEGMEGRRYRTVEVIDINLRRLKNSIDSILENPADQNLVMELADSFRRLTDVPLIPYLGKFEAMVKEVSAELGKSAQLTIVGDDVSIARGRLSAIQDFTVQILRNAIDHGLESPEDRKRAGKPDVGQLQISCRESASRLHLDIRDDGRGLDPQVLAAAAVRKGFISETEASALTDQQKIELIFLPGFSSREQANDYSGRGVGMDIVKSTIVRLNGDIKLVSQVGKGTEFTIELPVLGEA